MLRILIMSVSKKGSGNYSYFGNSLRMMALLHITGKFPNLYTYKTQTTNLKGEVNSDGTINAIDFAALKKALLSQTFSNINISNADMNNDSNINAIDFASLKVKLLIIKLAF